VHSAMGAGVGEGQEGESAKGGDCQLLCQGQDINSPSTGNPQRPTAALCLFEPAPASLLVPAPQPFAWEHLFAWKLLARRLKSSRMPWSEGHRQAQTRHPRQCWSGPARRDQPHCDAGGLFQQARAESSPTLAAGRQLPFQGPQPGSFTFSQMRALKVSGSRYDESTKFCALGCHVSGNPSQISPHEAGTSGIAASGTTEARA
jgi:hypothetical protein